MAVVSTLILRSMRLTGEKGRGATLDSNEQVETLAELNTFMDACNNERLFSYSMKEDVLTLTASTSAYTIGSGATFNVTRPTKIVDPCFVRDASNYDSPVKVVDADTFGRIKLKSVGNSYPNVLYYDAGYSATSSGTIFVYPSPVASLALHINSWTQLGNFSTLSQTVLLPPGYQLFIETNFAMHLATGLTPVSPELAKMAKEAKAAIKTLNLPAPISSLDDVYGRTGNIITGP